MAVQHKIVQFEGERERVPGKAIDFPLVKGEDGEPYTVQTHDPQKHYAQSIVVGYAHTGMVHDVFLKSLQQLQHASRNITSFISQSSCNVVLNRNLIIHSFLAIQPELSQWLLFLDTDIKCPPYTAAAMLKVAVETESDIVAVPYKLTSMASTVGRLEVEELPKRRIFPGGIERVDVGTGFNTQGEFTWDRVYDIHGAGTGCMMIRRSLLERMKEHYVELAPWEFCGYDPIIIHGKPDYESDDYSLCHRALDLGASIRSYTGVPLRHFKQFGLIFDGLEKAED